MIGARLKLARAAVGLSLRGLEEHLEGLVTAQAIGKYERNEMMPSSTVLIALARALAVTDEYLLHSAATELVSVEFRKKTLTSVREAKEVRARILSEVERYLDIEKILVIQPVKASPFAKRCPVHNVEGIEQAAKQLRKRWNLGNDPIPNLCEILEENGIKVRAILLPENVSGVQATVKAADGTAIPVIVVNAEHAGERQRFTLAQELGHLYLDVSRKLELEPTCQRFAAAFLVPRDVLVRKVGGIRHAISTRELFQLKQLFGISAQAIAYRCKDLEIINQRVLSGVFTLFNAKRWRTNEPLPLPIERPSRFERLCLRALAEDVISEGKASELLQKTVHEVIESLDGPPERASDRI